MSSFALVSLRRLTSSSGLEIDPILNLIPENLLKLSPEVKIKIRKEKVLGEQFPYIIKVRISPSELSRILLNTLIC